MSSHFAKPENALRKGQDLVKVGKPSSALKTLHNILVARRYRLWSPTHEKIMFFYIELAVDLRRNVKDALVQYRMICQQAQSASMEKVMRYYQKLTEEKANSAQIKAAAATAAQSAKGSDEVAVAEDAVEDLEEESPESIMLAAMSGEGTKERLDRQILTPWVKYLWECYRTILDVLRNNAKLELLYHATARAAFDFCKRFSRNMEFRRLCEILRNHLFTIAKFQNQTNAVDLNSADTQKLYLETRFMQLKMAADLELWQEAYRTIEDIHENMRLGARVEPPPELMKTYYEKLSQIFWASSNFLFHAYSLHKCYQLSAQEALALPAAVAAPAADAVVASSAIVSAPLSASQRTNLASAVVLSALIISGSNQSLDMHDIDSITGVEHEGNMRLAQLLGFKKESPSRQRILAAVQQSGVLNDANETSKTIFRLLENQFGPLSLYAQLKPLFATLKEDPELQKYVAPLEQLTIIRVLQQLSTVFKSMKIDKFVPLVPDIGSIYALERLIMTGITSDLLNLRFDHRTMTLIFPESDLEHPKMKDQLVTISKNFISLAHTLDAASATAQTQTDKLKERTHVFKLIQANLLEEHENVFLRQELIEKRKQELEKILHDKEKRAAEDKAAARRARDAEEHRRLTEELTRREEERTRIENNARELRTKQALAEEMKKKLEAVTASTNLSTAKAEKKIQALTQDLENIDKIQLMRAQDEILRTQQREIERRRRETNRRVDYTVRATRVEERDTLLAKMDSAREEEKEQFEADFAKYLEADRAAHAKAVIEQARLVARMSKEKAVFHEQLMQRRTELFKIEKEKQDERFAIKAEKRRKEEERRRKEEEVRERELAIQAERERRQREEDDRIEAEAALARQKKEEERLEKVRIQREAADKANEAAQARLKREEEAEAKERERRAAFQRPAAGGEARTWARQPAGPTGGASEDRFAQRSTGPSQDNRGGDFRRDAPRDAPRDGDFRRDAPREDNFRRDAPREDNFRRDAPREERPREDRPREDRPERDIGDFRSRPSQSPEEPRGGDSRWGANRGPAAGGDRRFDDRAERPSFRAQGGQDERPSFRAQGGQDDRQSFRAPAAGGDRDLPNRDSFGSRAAPGAGPRQGGADSRDWGAMRSNNAAQAPRGDAPVRREAAPAAAPRDAAPAPDAGASDGFTQVRSARR